MFDGRWRWVRGAAFVMALVLAFTGLTAVATVTGAAAEAGCGPVRGAAVPSVHDDGARRGAGARGAEPEASVATQVAARASATYSAPETARRMISDKQYRSAVTLTNTTAAPFAASTRVLSCHWTRPNGEDATSAGNREEVRLPGDLAPGASVTLDALSPTRCRSASSSSSR
ncbi:hypothetical protein DMP23_20565 [Amycolatopsis sp. A1MSW2902]|uniref:hypothetical protein n=1 Tax=Amycolatopsis sp. A1MSW2902 TaxID=687413 RepID=UPI00307D15F4